MPVMYPNASAKADEILAVCPSVGLEDATLFVATLNSTDERC